MNKSCICGCCRPVSSSFDQYIWPERKWLDGIPVWPPPYLRALGYSAGPESTWPGSPTAEAGELVLCFEWLWRRGLMIYLVGYFKFSFTRGGKCVHSHTTIYLHLVWKVHIWIRPSISLLLYRCNICPGFQHDITPYRAHAHKCYSPMNRVPEHDFLTFFMLHRTKSKPMHFEWGYS